MGQGLDEGMFNAASRVQNTYPPHIALQPHAGDPDRLAPIPHISHSSLSSPV